MKGKSTTLYLLQCPSYGKYVLACDLLIEFGLQTLRSAAWGDAAEAGKNEELLRLVVDGSAFYFLAVGISCCRCNRARFTIH